MKLAFYKSAQGSSWYRRAQHWLISKWTHGKYSHVEFIVKPINAKKYQYMCASAAPRDGKVRFKVLTLKPERWDIVDVPTVSDAQMEAWFREHKDAKYDYLGLVGFVFRPIKGRSKKYFCSEAIAEAMGLNNPSRISPNSLYTAVKLLGDTMKEIRGENGEEA